MNKLLLAGVLAISSFSAIAADESAMEVKLKKAMKSEIRTEKEVARDRNRLPLQTLKFFGLKDDMKVVELLPGGGWYSKLLAPVLAENGDFSVAVGTRRAAGLVEQPSMEKMRVLEVDPKIRREKGDRFLTMNKFDLGEKDVDIVFTFRNYHNLNENGRKRMNDASFKALKSGGIYAVVDHTRRHMEKLNNENGRRFDPVLAIKEIQAAGFEFVDYSSLHYRADDELRYEVGRKSVTGNSDRFTLKFRKP
jgi:predicted methyltransferase